VSTRKPLTRAQRKVHELELALTQARKVQYISGILARVRREVPKVPVTHTPIHFVRPVKGYTLPSLGMWHRWLESRIGSFVLNSILHTLCLSCGIPIPVSSGEKSVWGSRDKKTVKEGKGNKVTVGALVKWTEETVAVHGVYNPTAPTVIEIEEEKVVRLVTASGLGCSECLLHFAKVTGTELRSHEQRLTEHTRKYAAWERAVNAYRKAAGTTADPMYLSHQGIATPPKTPTPYILVDPKAIEVEKTIRFYNPQYGVTQSRPFPQELSILQQIPADNGVIPQESE